MERPPTADEANALFQVNNLFVGDPTPGAANVDIPEEWKPPTVTSFNGNGVGYVHPEVMKALLPAEDLEVGYTRLWSLEKNPKKVILRPALLQMAPTVRRPEGYQTEFIWSYQVDAVEEILRPAKEFRFINNVCIVESEDAEWLMSLDPRGNRRFPYLRQDDLPNWVSCPNCGFPTKCMDMLLMHFKVEHGV